ncbi:DUF1902 domain-containing protein [Achromobacter sp. LC458]|uniref:DUF1902 domain-containing protein n=1 Tax=Achromobacter sp. LC458 TaxID=1120623 RepID=UPI000629EDB6|nr:DUF1902 domain-containing protein [Achromobacter sp. LC458]TRM53235.1 DUF1902 domain-containing protein [Achromobacter sp. LC458]
MYRVGLPFWKQVARAGLRVSFRVDVSYDKEAQVYLATSPDLKGFIVEAASMDELAREANEVVCMLMETKLHSSKAKAEPIYHHIGAAVASA